MFTRKVSPVIGMLSIAMGVMILVAPTARASNLDDAFLKGSASAIRDYLQKQSYKNVGVLRFEVKEGKKPASMNSGKMNSLTATRLENALIHVNDLANPVGITRGAGGVAAAKDKSANWHSTIGRKKLFANKYPLAWGSSSVQVDAFLTGTVEVSPDFSKTTITVKIFDKKDADLRNVIPPFTVNTDRDGLREMGHSFVLTKRSIKILSRDGEVTDAELDKEAAKDVAQDGSLTTPMTGAGAGKNVDDVKEYVDFKILIDGVPVEVKAEGDHGRIDTPSPDQKVEIKVTAKEKLGLLLKVNGVNTLNKERDERDRQESSWWILDAGKEYTIGGFYKDGKMEAFKVLADAGVDVSELGEKQDRHGVISFEIFKGSGGGSAGEPRIVSRSTSNLLRVNTRSATLAEAQKSLKATMNKMGKRNVYIVGRGEEAVALESEAFQGAFVVGCDVMYRPK